MGTGAVDHNGRVITGLGLYRLRSLPLQVFTPETNLVRVFCFR
jgi:hypothetical protein